MLDRKLRNWVPSRQGWLGLLVLAGLAAWAGSSALARQEASPTQRVNEVQPADSPPVVPDALPDPAPAEDVSSGEVAGELDEVVAAVPEVWNPRTKYGLYVLAPAAVAILFAILTRQVVPSLLIGLFVGAFMMLPCLPTSDPYRQTNSVVGGFRLAMERYLLGAIHQVPHEGTIVFADLKFAHLQIIVFTLVIGFMVGVIGRNGGTDGLVGLVAGETRSRRRGALTAWFAGLIVFFDDYANAMIVGPTMRGVFDRLKLSRAKLAYIVDSTAAPVASIALIGTWVGAEMGYIQQGLDEVAASGSALTNAQGATLTGMTAFVQSIPYRFYPILALFLVFLVSLTGRDFGPMKRSEQKALNENDSAGLVGGSEFQTGEARAIPRWWLGLFPVVSLVLGTVVVLVVTGWYDAGTVELVGAVDDAGASTWAQKAWWDKAGIVLSNADPNGSIFHGSLIAAMVAVGLTVIARACPMRDMFDAGLEGMSRMFSAIVVLVLAWALSTVLQNLEVGEVVAAKLNAMNFQAQWLPLGLFVTAALISFATGTSWGTMGILCPMAVSVGARLTVGLDPVESMNLLYAAIGSVLAGAVFGDHCSPISDTTVLSSVASGCRHEEHVWTQIPYALLAAFAAMGLGDVMCSVYKQPWYYGLGAGAIFLTLFLFIFGRRAVEKSPPAVPRVADGPMFPTGGIQG